MVGVIIEVILVGISFYNLLKYEGIDLLGIRIDFLIFFIPCFLISFGELVSVNYSFGLWEGANYVIPVWGSLLAVLIQEQKLRTEQRA